MNKQLGLMIGAMFALSVAQQATAACSDVTRAELQDVVDSVDRGEDGTDGFGLDMWVTMVDETGAVCHVVNTGADGALSGNQQWLGSRVISAQKANTANAFSLDGVAISSGALYATNQDGGSLSGLQHSNPVDASRAYTGNPKHYGTKVDPLNKLRIGGVNVFGGGLALYREGVKIGAIGVSGDTSCTDHAFAWRVRADLGLDEFSGAAFEMLTLVDTEAVSMSDGYNSTVQHAGAIDNSTLGEHPDCAYTRNIRYNGNYGFNDSNGHVENAGSN